MKVNYKKQSGEHEPIVEGKELFPLNVWFERVL
jgi:hypothetical protein